MSGVPNDMADRAEQAENRTFRVSAVGVSDSGRVIIPSRFRDRHGVEEDDIIDLRVRGEDITFWTLDLVVDGSGRVRIPSRKRKLYGVEDGDVVDIDVIPTGMNAEEM